MATPPAFFTHGTVDLAFPDRRIRRVVNDLAEVQQQFQRATTGAINVGDVFPGLSSYKVSSVTETEETTGCFVYDVTGAGVVGGSGGVLTFDVQEEEVEDGFDAASQTVLSGNKMQVRLGQAMAGNGGMVCVSVRRRQHPAHGSFWFNDCQYKGMLGTKAVKERWSSAGREITKEQFVNSLEGGWDYPARSSFLFPRVTMQRSYVSSTVPDQTIPTQGVTPPNAPSAWEPPFTAEMAEITHNWPNGWTLVGLDVDILAGTTISFVAEQWTFNPKFTL